MHYEKGFFLSKPTGNNIFSYNERKKIKKIYIPAIKKVEEIILNEGKEYGFAEIEDKAEVGFKGLELFLNYTNHNEVDFYIFDNHNHAFYFIYQEVFRKKTEKGLKMIHFDQHKDTRIPDSWLEDIKEKDVKNFFEEISIDVSQNITVLDKVFYYTNAVLNVGNFIAPLQKENIISELIIIDSTYSIDSSRELLKNDENFIVDIDLDFFSEDMDYINYEAKINIIRDFLKKASIVTIATSPFFIDFKRAEKALYDILI